MDKRDGEEVVAIKKFIPRFHAGTQSMVFLFIAAVLPATTPFEILRRQICVHNCIDGGWNGRLAERP